METVQEVWRPVNGEFEGWNYEVSNLGRLRNSQTGQMRKPGTTRDGYSRTTIFKKGVMRTVFLHNLILEAFGSPRLAGYEANHKDLDKKNNSFSNLEWVTRQENMYHAYKNCRLSTFSVSDAVDIILSKKTYVALAKEYGLSKVTIYRIRRGLRHKDAMEIALKIR